MILLLSVHFRNNSYCYLLFSFQLLEKEKKIIIKMQIELAVENRFRRFPYGSLSDPNSSGQAVVKTMMVSVSGHLTIRSQQLEQYCAVFVLSHNGAKNTIPHTQIPVC